MTKASVRSTPLDRPQSAFDIYCLRCGFDKRWPAHNCDHQQRSILGHNTNRLLQRPLVLDGIYTPYTGRHER